MPNDSKNPYSKKLSQWHDYILFDIAIEKAKKHHI